MGSGAEASEGVAPPPLVSMCSTVDTSMGCSTEPGVRWAGQVVSAGPRSQQSPLTNFKGLWKKDGTFSVLS